MKLQARNFVVRKPETIDITMFFKKFCIATRTTSRPKTQFSDGYFMPSTQKSPVQGPKSRKKEGLFPQISAIFLIFGITILR